MASPIQQSPDGLQPNRLLSLWDLFVLMKPFDAASFMFISGIATSHRMVHEAQQTLKERGWFNLLAAKDSPLHQGGVGRQKLTRGQAESLKGAFEAVLSGCEEVGLDATEDTITKIVALLGRDGATWGEYHKLLAELDGRLLAQMRRRVFFSLNSEEARYYSKPQEGWEEIIRKFPRASSDIEEARKCFALSRYAAAVFHSLQIMESGLIALSKLLGSQDPNPGWNSACAGLEAVLKKKHQDRTRFEQENFAFLEQMQGTVVALKNAWRNKVSHANGKLVVMTADFSPDIAEEILSATRAFMRRLATEAPWPSGE